MIPDRQCLSHGSIIISYYCCRSRLLRNGSSVYELWIFSCNFSEELSRKNEMDLSWECYLNYSLRSQYIFSLIWSNLSFSRWKQRKERKKKSKKPKSIPFVIFRRGSFPVWGSFAVGDHLRRCTELNDNSQSTTNMLPDYWGTFMSRSTHPHGMLKTPSLSIPFKLICSTWWHLPKSPLRIQSTFLLSTEKSANQLMDQDSRRF